MGTQILQMNEKYNVNEGQQKNCSFYSYTVSKNNENLNFPN